VQDRALDWGVAVERAPEDLTQYSAMKSTKQARRVRGAK
jgi:hypothetical protein